LRARQRLTAGLARKQLHKVPGSLVWRQERDDDRARTAFLTAQPFTHFSERIVIAQPGAKLRHIQPRTVPALAALRTVVVRVVDIAEFSGFETSVFHGTNGSAGGLWIAAV
jgi:hypothetical protein